MCRQLVRSASGKGAKERGKQLVCDIPSRQRICGALLCSRQLVCSALSCAGGRSAVLLAKASGWSARPVNDDLLFWILVFVET